jgi:antitoxin component YwqK of YwqJK toxin-antitoxin module
MLNLVLNKVRMKKIITLAFFCLIVINQYAQTQIQSNNETPSSITGNIVFYYANGNIKETGSYLNGERHGLWQRFDEKGNKLGEGNYMNGIKHGKWVIWDEKQIKRFEFNYINGVKSDLWCSWDENGILVASANYRNQ